MNNKFIKPTIFFILFAFITLSVNAQHGKNKERIREKVKTQKVSFISEKLDLSEVEAQKFWPIYDAYHTDLRKLKSSLNLHPKEDISDKEAEDMLNAFLEGKSKETEIQKRYIDKLKTVIPPSKVANLFRVEREFKEKVISSIRKHHKEK